MKSLTAFFEELMTHNPIYYEPLIEINRKRRTENLNKDVLNRALNAFYSELNKDDITVRSWVRAWTHITACMVKKDAYDQAESALTEEMKRHTGEDGVVKRKFLERLMAQVYLDRVRQLVEEAKEETGDPDQVDESYLLELYTKAFRFDAKNQQVLRGIARLVINGSPEVAERAKMIYDPRAHADAPALVMNELGSDALSKAEYESAIRYFELARQKAPKNPMVLNNLAYTYLVCEKRNPTRALKLVDEAIRYLPRDETGTSGANSLFRYARQCLDAIESDDRSCRRL